MDPKEIEKALDGCTRFLTGHYRQTPRQALFSLAEWVNPELKSDIYGQGDLIADFEKEIAVLLGKEQAVFMPSGTMCQQIALRIWADRRKTPHVAFHPKCHLEIHEQKGYQLLHGLHGVLVGSPDALMTLNDLQQVREPLAALLVELPQREIGGQLPAWDDLKTMVEWARQQGIAVHLDGARLWECQPFYQRSYAEIAALFDSVYVSFYKGLGGLAGSILAGPADLIGEARLWQRRHGGNLIRLYPYVLSARQGLQQRLGRMPAYHLKAVEIATLFAGFPQVIVVPNPPPTNMMHVYIRGDRERMQQAVVEIAQETHTWLFPHLVPGALPEYVKSELSIGDASLDLSRQEIGSLLETFFERIYSDLRNS